MGRKRRFDGVFVTHVQRITQCLATQALELGHGRINLVLRAAGHGHVRARVRETAGNPEIDAAGAAENEYAFA